MLEVVWVDYGSPGQLTGLGDAAVVLGGVDGGALDVCLPVHELVIQPGDAQALSLPEERFGENQIRPAQELFTRLLRMDPAALTTPRAPERRIIGTCRHFAVLACALLRHQGIESRVRCGFATYFQPGQALDHWIIEYRQDHRWVRLDPEVLGQDVVEHPSDLAAGAFLSAAEAWRAFRARDIDAMMFGVHGTENFGPAEIRGNLVKDLAALNKIEMLPWDEWGRMTEAYEGQTGEDYDELLDTVADACNSDDLRAITELYEHPDLRVPDALIA